MESYLQKVSYSEAICVGVLGWTIMKLLLFVLAISYNLLKAGYMPGIILSTFLDS